MDSETGERFRDKETGEMPPAAKANAETGELEINRNQPEKQNVQRKFRIPKKEPKSQRNQTQKKKKSLQMTTNGDTICASDVIPCLVILLPTLLFFHPVIGMFVALIETILHVWAHKKNKTLSKSDVQYRSPLHIFIREFCGACKWERSVNKITSMQDKRNYKFIKYGIDYVHGIVM